MRRSLSLLTIALLAGTAGIASAQNAEVTFYSTGSLSKALLVPHSEDAAFYGWLFDGTQKLGGIANNQFLTFKLPMGHHRFSGGDSARHPPGNGFLDLDLAEGEQRFIRLKAKVTNAVVYSSLTAELTDVSCSIAQQEANATKPAKVKYVPGEVKSMLVDSKGLPACKLDNP